MSILIFRIYFFQLQNVGIEVLIHTCVTGILEKGASPLANSQAVIPKLYISVFVS